MKYIRTKDGKIKERVALNINDIESVENLWCDFNFSDGILRFVDYFPKEKETLEILQKELKNVVFTKEKANSDYYSYDYQPIKKGEIIKQANTIEELCDEFVLYENSHCCIIGDIEAKEMATTNYGIIYGAIWTKWGLKYVAKFNDKGELELL